MKIGIMIMDKAGEYIAIARDKFDPKDGYSDEALHKLFHKALWRLKNKLEKVKEQEDERD